MKPSDGKPATSSTSSEKSINREVKSVSRRQFIGAASGVAGAALLPGMAFGAEPVAKNQHWDFDSDVVVVGSGAAGSCAALYAARDGAKVFMLEKASYYGGTTQKSQGAYWVPNNSLMRERGLVDDRLDALRYMVRLSFPTLYQADHPTLGLAQAQFDLIATYFDHGTRVIDELAEMDVLQSTFFRGLDGTDFPDYYAHLEENKSPIGRILLPKDSNGHPGFG
ncbi:MAG: FAD-dependent oxidoreductase, partial [Immundisolibacteraceae bacterium]|nr:FAD-dependent oxidoreductase [Immundisolibacteraceae bacterium]